MRATTIHAPRDIRVSDVPDPTITAPTDAIIKVTAGCICGSDLWPYRGENDIDAWMIPYFGKNNVHYDKFEWFIYTTDHFEIYYYPEEEQHLERIAGYAESAYQHVSSDLKHDLAFKVPLIIFKTHSEFEQQNVAPGAAQEGVLAFVEPVPTGGARLSLASAPVRRAAR